MKKNLFVLLIIMSIFFVFMTVVHSAEIVDSGNCGADGDNVTWTLDDEGTLTISGEGEMEDYIRYNSPFYSKSDIHNVTIEDGVTHIGVNAFMGCGDITSIILSASLVNIGEEAFEYCYNLESVFISDLACYLNIEFQGSYSNPMSYAYKLYLNNNRVLGTITIPDGVEIIPAHAFDGCDGIRNMVIPDSVTQIGNYAFKDCKSLTDVTLPRSVKKIESRAFYNCTGLTNISIAENLTSIGFDAFYNCKKLNSVSIPNVVAWCNITFDGGTSNPMCYAENLYIDGEAANEIEIPKEITSIGNYTFYHCTGITSVNIPDGVTDIGSYTFYNCTELTSIVLPDSIDKIGDGAFSECSALTSIIIPDSVTSIGEYAFGNAGIITINYNAEKVYSNIFKQDYHFSGNNKMKLVILGDNVSIIDKNAFVGCGKLRKIYISKNVREIEQNAFGSCSDLKVVYFGGSQEEWDEVYVGSENENLTSAEIIYNSSPDDVVISSEDYLSFQIDESDQSVTITGCENTIDKITVPSKYRGYPVTTIGGGAFYNCGNLQEISLPDTITKIQQSAFEYCTGLTSISIPNSVMDIDNYAFMFCSNLVDVKIGSSVKSIGVAAFAECPNIEKLTLPKSIEIIRNANFRDSSKLIDVYYSGTVDEWNEIDIGPYNDFLTNATLHTAEGTTIIYPYEIQSVSLTDTLGNTISAPKLNQSFIVDTQFYKKKYRNNEDYFFVAVYGTDNTLLSIDYVKAKFAEGYIYSVGFNIPPQLQEIGVVKAFVWNTFNSLEPLAETKNLEFPQFDNPQIKTSVVECEPQDMYSEFVDDTVKEIRLFTNSKTTHSWKSLNREFSEKLRTGDVISCTFDDNGFIQNEEAIIKYADIANILDMPLTGKNDMIYKWDIDIPLSNGTRIAMFNISQIIADDNLLFVTKNGFTNADDFLMIDDSIYEEIRIVPETNILRMETERDEISRYVEDTVYDMTIEDLRDAKNYGSDCSKILVIFENDTAKTILVCL